MLVLSRKAGEAIVLAGNIKVQVLGIENDRVKLGVEAPADVLVLRSELLRDQYRDERPDHREFREPAAEPARRYELELELSSEPARQPLPAQPLPAQPRPYAPRQPRYIRSQNGPRTF